MHARHSCLLLGTLLAGLAATAGAAEDAKKTWDVNAPPGERRENPNRRALRHLDERGREP